MSDELLKRLEEMASQHFAGNVAHRRLVGTTLDAAAARIRELEVENAKLRKEQGKLDKQGRGARHRIREQRELLDECELAFDQIKLHLFNGHAAGAITKCGVMLAKLRKKKADE